MIVAIKLLKINPANGQSYFSPQFVEPMFSVDIDEFVKSYEMKMQATEPARKVALVEILQKFAIAFNCPIGWLAVSADDTQQTKEQIFIGRESKVDLTMKPRAPHPAIKANGN